MPRNTQGIYTLPAGNPVVPGTLIETTWANPTMSDIAAALTGSLPRDGSAPMTGDLQLSGATPATGRSAVSKDYVTSFLATATGMPTGSVVAYSGNVAPPGFLECNGQAVNRTTYSDLFGIIGTIYGSGDGSTTFNVPDMRDEFIRGKNDSRAVGSKQAAAFASHNHALSDPGHVHTQAAHSHAVTTSAHTHVVNDPGHTHSLNEPTVAGSGFAYGIGAIQTGGQTGSSGTGISLQAATPSGNSDQQTPAIASAVSGITMGTAGGDETRPQNIAQIYIIKAISDAGPISGIIGITSSDTNIIDIGVSNPAIPELVIHSNVAFGTVKLDASGKVPQNLVNISTFVYLGPWDASGGQNPSQALPSEVFENGDLYQISVGGTIQLRDSAGVLSSTPVVSTDQIVYVTGSTVGLPDGWYFQPTTAITGITAGAVSFVPTGSIGAVNVQDAIVEVANESAPLSHVGSGGAQHANVVASGAAGFMTGADKAKLDSVEANAQVNTVQSVNSKTGAVVLTASDVGALTQAGADSLYVNVSGDTMSGQLKGIAPVAPEDLTRKDYVDGLFAKQTVLFRANKTNGQALPAGASTTLLFNQVVFDTKNGYNASTGEYTIQEAGLYLFVTRTRILQGSVGGELSGGGGVTGAGVLDGGANSITIPHPANAQSVLNCTLIAWCPAGSVFQDSWFSENAASVVATPNPNTMMSVTRIG